MDSSGLGSLVIRQRNLGVLAVLLSGIVLWATNVSFANEEKNYSYGLQGNNLVFKTVEDANKGGSFRLAIKDGQPGTISVELVDIVSNSSGSKISIPLNSSPFTPFGLVRFTESYPSYQPSDEFQYFDISMSFEEGVSLDRPVLGGLAISLIPDDQSAEAIDIASSIVATFAYIPPAGISPQDYNPAIGLTGPTIERVNPDFFPLNLIPDLPFVYNHGEFLVEYQLENTGDIFLDTTTEVSVETLGLAGSQDAEVFNQSDTVFLVPGQKSNKAVEINPQNSTGNLLGLGIYRLTTTATGEMGDQLATNSANQQTLIVFPWKQSVLLLALIVVFRRRIARAFNWLLGYVKALRDFRYSNTVNPAKDRTPKPVTARVTQPTPQPVSRPDPEAKQTFQARVTTTPSLGSKPSQSPPRPLYPYWYEPPKKDN